ncbi:hypothetical protein IW262DRAFT_1528016 [Armillaria fumosa]|nr:hypothetical protein IW262DRAFT_1528016 [Armillaria fumosa]
MSITPFHAIILLSLASVSFTLQIQIPDEKHIAGQSTTVTLIHEEGDPTDIFLERIAQNNRTNNIVLQVINFTANEEFNITFSLSGKHSILAHEIGPSSNRTIAESPEFDVQGGHHLLSDDQKGGSDKGLIIGAVLGSVAFTIIIVLTVYLIFFRSRRCRSIQDGFIRNSLTRPNPFLNYITTKCNPRPKPVRLDDSALESSVSGGMVQCGSIHAVVEESGQHESTVSQWKPRAMSNGSAGEIQRLRAQIQQLILDRESARSPDNEQDPPLAYGEEVAENVSRVEKSPS